ncbi:hypothetical protein EB796_019602 [Bugula neritina]|uniref:Uncharacterized protein n=1 Tax=Bugula neritina TaxID=10212 RepID=A0A7J7J9Q4_BUGNE|nr:hypothetical protein EB796_019602 [Bugula neritina]
MITCSSSSRCSLPRICKSFSRRCPFQHRLTFVQKCYLQSKRAVAEMTAQSKCLQKNELWSVERITISDTKDVNRYQLLF